jgi:hypothetical protein
VTTSCNNCHGALDHAFVVIHEPGVSPYADQSLGGGGGARRAKGRK